MPSKEPNLLTIAYRAMEFYGLEPEFPPQAMIQLESIREAASANSNQVRDLTDLLWCSIDNDESRDLDQLTVAEPIDQGKTKIYVAIADVDALVKKDSPIDQHAKKNTTSVYTGVRIFSMLPEKLSTNLTSLSEHETRLSIIMEMTIDETGEIVDSNIYRASVKNWAKLAYHSVAAWLNGQSELPTAAARVKGMDEQLRIQDRVAQKMRGVRYEHGALELETIQSKTVVENGQVKEIKNDEKNRARELIEDFMIGANGVTARFLAARKFPTLRRVVRSPERWAKIVAVAKERGEELPIAPDSKALAKFLSEQKQRDPLRFPDLSLTVIKLMGRGEYIIETPGETPAGHFGLAVNDYSHSTAPNRRYPDLITHRLIKAALAQSSVPYEMNELSALALHCTQMENAADKVERQVRKSEAALYLSHRLGEVFDAIVTGASEKGTWARALSLPVEGKVVQGERGLDVGDRVRIKLIHTDVERGFIDFSAIRHY